MQLIVQTLSYDVFNESDKINKLFKLGLDIIHINKPKYSKKELFFLLKGINTKYHDRIILHNHFSLLNKFSLKGIHVDEKSFNKFLLKAYFKLLKNKYKIYVSSTIENFKSKSITSNTIDLFHLGPVFMKYSEGVIVDKLNLSRESINIKSFKKDLFAIDCFTIENINSIIEVGIKAPILKDIIWKSGDYLKAFKSLKLELEKVEIENNIAI